MQQHATARRRFLALGAAGFAAFALTGKATTLGSRPISWLDAFDFSSLEGQRVELRGADGTRCSGRVVSVARDDRRDGGHPLEQFSLVVRTDLRERPEQQTFALSHPEWGDTSLFMVPVVSRSRGVHLEAVVSRLVG